MNPPEPNLVKEYLDQGSIAADAAYGPTGVIIICLMAVIIFILLAWVAALWSSIRADKKYENQLREKLMKQEHDDTVLLAQTVQELTSIIKALGPSHNIQTDRVINHINALLTALLERNREATRPV
jgi:hypothetical protein